MLKLTTPLARPERCLLRGSSSSCVAFPRLVDIRRFGGMLMVYFFHHGASRENPLVLHGWDVR
jgi:hypothetical protein